MGAAINARIKCHTLKCAIFFPDRSTLENFFDLFRNSILLKLITIRTGAVR